MSTIRKLLQVAEFSLKEAEAKTKRHGTAHIDNEIRISEAASLLVIARSLDHIITHGFGPAPYSSDSR